MNKNHGEGKVILGNFSGEEERQDNELEVLHGPLMLAAAQHSLRVLNERLTEYKLDEKSQQKFATLFTSPNVITRAMNREEVIRSSLILQDAVHPFGEEEQSILFRRIVPAWVCTEKAMKIFASEELFRPLGSVKIDDKQEWLKKVGTFALMQSRDVAHKLLTGAKNRRFYAEQVQWQRWAIGIGRLELFNLVNDWLATGEEELSYIFDNLDNEYRARLIETVTSKSYSPKDLGRLYAEAFPLERGEIEMYSRARQENPTKPVL